MPPATTTFAWPDLNVFPPSIIDFIAEPHTLLIVLHKVDSSSPAFNAACLAGAWPWPAERTDPIRTSSTSEQSSPLVSIAELIATAPSDGAVTDDKAPSILPMGVRVPERIAIGFDISVSFIEILRICYFTTLRDGFDLD